MRPRQHLQQIIRRNVHLQGLGGAGEGGAGGRRRRAAIIEHREMEAGEPVRTSKASERPSSGRGRQVGASGLQEQTARMFRLRSEAGAGGVITGMYGK